MNNKKSMVYVEYRNTKKRETVGQNMLPPSCCFKNFLRSQI